MVSVTRIRRPTIGPLVLWAAFFSPFLRPALCAGQAPPATYKVIDLVPSLVRTIVETPGLNDRGEVAFWHSVNGNTVQGVLLQGTESTEIVGLPGFPVVYPADISADGTIVGQLQAAQDIRFTRAFTWRQGELQILAPLDGGITSAAAINRKGKIVGEAQVGSGAFHAVIWQSNAPHDLGTLANGNYSKARDINNQDIVVGEANTVVNGKPHAFVWQRGQMRQLPDLSGGTFCSAQAINDRAEIVGACDKASGDARGVLWRDGKAIDLGILGHDDDAVTTALDINDHSQIVGGAQITDGKLRAFLWERGTMYDLNRLISPHSGWLLLVASRINESGEILGYGYYRDGIHSFLLVPQAPAAALRAQPAGAAE